MGPNYLVPLALGAIVTGVPLLIAKKRQGYLGSRPIAELGEQQRYFRKAAAGDTLIDLVKTHPGSHMRIVCGNFRTDKWGLHTRWFQFVRQELEKGTKVTAYGSTDADAGKERDMLCKLGLGYICIKEIPIQHYVIIDDPQQVWAEERHVGYYAYGCIYTDSPYREVWKNLENYFIRLDTIGSRYEPKINNKV